MNLNLVGLFSIPHSSSSQGGATIFKDFSSDNLLTHTRLCYLCATKYQKLILLDYHISNLCDKERFFYVWLLIAKRIILRHNQSNCFMFINPTNQIWYWRKLILVNGLLATIAAIMIYPQCIKLCHNRLYRLVENTHK